MIGRSPTYARSTRVGLIYAVAAYAWWGIVPIFWKYLTHVPVLELLAHRVAWSLPIFAGLLWLRAGVADLRTRTGEARVLRIFSISSILLAVNWGVFVYAVEADRVLHASLGYFLTPLVSVLLGAVVLGERLRRVQWVAVALAATGVALLSTQADEVPWIALVLAGSFGLYGLARKTAPMGALPGSTLEVVFLIPFALGYIVWASTDGAGAFSLDDIQTSLLLMATGLITATPLLWFARAARKLPLSTIGFVQYLAPTGQFLLAVLAFGEVFTPVHQRGFALIWAGVAVFTLESWRSRSRA